MFSNLCRKQLQTLGNFFCCALCSATAQLPFGDSLLQPATKTSIDSSTTATTDQPFEIIFAPPVRLTNRHRSDPKASTLLSPLLVMSPPSSTSVPSSSAFGLSSEPSSASSSLSVAFRRKKSSSRDSRRAKGKPSSRDSRRAEGKPSSRDSRRAKDKSKVRGNGSGKRRQGEGGSKGRGIASEAHLVGKRRHARSSKGDGHHLHSKGKDRTVAVALPRTQFAAQRSTATTQHLCEAPGERITEQHLGNKGGGCK